MSNLIFSKTSEVPAPVEDLFAFHENPGAFQRLNPPWEPAEIIHQDKGIQDGAEVKIKIQIGPLPQVMHVRHEGYVKNEQFQDRQLKGIFPYWLHTHKMQPKGDNSTIEDAIEYRLPMGFLGRVFGGGFAKAKLERMFNYRHEITRQDMATHQAYKDVAPKRIVITGSSGLIGQQLVAFLSTGGHSVCRLVRRKNTADNEAYWNPATGEIDMSVLENADAVIHLAGESIGDKRWTDAQKARILESRRQGTSLLAETIAKMGESVRPKALISASAIGYYGEGGDTLLTEDMASGESFQAEVCRVWEDSTQAAKDAGVRVVTLRIGVVLAVNGGALAKMLTPFLLGAGGPLGNGRQYFSWIALDDLLGIMHHAVMNDDTSGVYNAVAPRSVTNKEFTKVLGRVIQRPTLIPIPRLPLRILFGKLADELLFASLRVDGDKIQEAGYQFRYPELEGALRHVLGRVKA